MEKSLSLGEDNFLGFDPFSDFPFSGKALYQALQPWSGENYQEWISALAEKFPSNDENIGHIRFTTIEKGCEGARVIRQGEDDRLSFAAAKRACPSECFVKIICQLEAAYDNSDAAAVRAFRMCTPEDALDENYPLSDKGFCAKLLDSTGFDTFFIVSQKQIDALRKDYERICQAKKEIALCGQQYDARALEYMMRQFELLYHYRHRDVVPEEKTEKGMQKYIIKHFGEIFPLYSFVKAEYPIAGVGRVDILARDEHGRDVVIELKKGRANPTRQLLDYATAFDRPILIGITEAPLSNKSKREGINYLIFTDLCELAK